MSVPPAPGSRERPRPAGFWPGTASALSRHLLVSVPWATLLAGCATGTVLLALLGATSRTALDQGTVRLTFLPAVAAVAFVPRTPSPALAGAVPLPAWVPAATLTLLAVPAMAITCWAQLMIMASTVPVGAGHPPAIYPLVAQFSGWCAIGVAIAAVCDRTRYSDLGGAIAAPLALGAIALAWVTPGLKDALALPPATPRTATIAWSILATGALAIAAAGMRDRWHRYAVVHSCTGQGRPPGHRGPTVDALHRGFCGTPYRHESEEHLDRTRTAIGHLSPNGAATKLIPSSWRQAQGCAVLAAVVITASLAAAQSSSSAVAVAAPGRPAPAVHGEVHLVIWSVDSDGPDFQAVLSGAIGDYGPAVTVLSDGKVDQDHTSEMDLELRHGTFRLYIGAIAGKFRAQTADEPTYLATCSDCVNVTANVPVVAGSGTGSYREVRGNFSLSLTGVEDQITPPCRPGFARQILMLMGSGTVSS